MKAKSLLKNLSRYLKSHKRKLLVNLNDYLKLILYIIVLLNNIFKFILITILTNKYKFNHL
jgi:hypothetical protein